MEANEIRSRLSSVDRCDHHMELPVDQLRSTLGLEYIIGESPVFVTLLKQIASIAKHAVSVLILGETGTGKEVFARAIHYCSPRSDRPFIRVSWGATLFYFCENDFFGHEWGAFTSATPSGGGIIKEAGGGSFFRDEVFCLPP